MRIVTNQLNNCGCEVHSLDAVRVKDLFVAVLDVIHRGCGAHQADLHLQVCQLALVLDILSNSLKDGKQLLAAQRHTKGSVSVQKKLKLLSVDANAPANCFRTGLQHQMRCVAANASVREVRLTQEVEDAAHCSRRRRKL